MGSCYIAPPSTDIMLCLNVLADVKFSRNVIIHIQAGLYPDPKLLVVLQQCCVVVYPVAEVVRWVEDEVEDEVN